METPLLKAARPFASLLGYALYDRTLLSGPCAGGCDHRADALLVLHQEGRMILRISCLSGVVGSKEDGPTAPPPIELSARLLLHLSLLF